MTLQECKEQRNKALIREFKAVRKLECHPRDKVFISVVSDIIKGDEELTKQARIMLVEYDKEFNATIITNGNTSQ